MGDPFVYFFFPVAFIAVSIWFIRSTIITVSFNIFRLLCRATLLVVYDFIGSIGVIQVVPSRGVVLVAVIAELDAYLQVIEAGIVVQSHMGKGLVFPLQGVWIILKEFPTVRQWRHLISMLVGRLLTLVYDYQPNL